MPPGAQLWCALRSPLRSPPLLLQGGRGRGHDDGSGSYGREDPGLLRNRSGGLLCIGLFFVKPSLYRGEGVGRLRGLDVVRLERGDGAGGAVGFAVGGVVVIVVVIAAAATTTTTVVAGEGSAVPVMFWFRRCVSSRVLSGEKSVTP